MKVLILIMMLTTNVQQEYDSKVRLDKITYKFVDKILYHFSTSDGIEFLVTSDTKITDKNNKEIKIGKEVELDEFADMLKTKKVK